MRMWMKMTDEAREQLEVLLEDFGDDVFGFAEEYENQGICYQCGGVQPGVEPDAEGYTCEDCGEPAVGGIELAMVNLL